MDIFQDRDFKPMLLKEIDKPFDSLDYLYELKFDGIRALIFANNKKVIIKSRNKKDITSYFPELLNLKNNLTKNVIFDGEIVIFKDGKPNFNEISKRLHLKTKVLIQKEMINNPVIFMVFDIIYENKDLRNYPLDIRKKILSKYEDTDYFEKVKCYSFGESLFKAVKKLSLEGIVMKKKDSFYLINTRSNSFLKVKNYKSATFYIGGYIINKNNTITLVLGEKKAKKLKFITKVTTSNKYLEKLNCYKSNINYFQDFNENINFVKPKLKCKIKYLEKVNNDYLREVVFKEII